MTALVTPEGRILWIKSIWTAKRFQDNPASPLKYSCSLVVDKANPAFQPVIDAFNVEAMTIEGTTPPQAAGQLAIMPYGKRYNILDGAVRFPGDPFYADKWVLSCTRAEEDGQPKVYVGAGQPLMNKGDIYDGALVQLHINFYAYGGGTGGVNADILAIMKTGDDSPLGHADPDSAEAFAAAGVVGVGASQPQQPAPAGFGVPGQLPVQPAVPLQPAYQQPVPQQPAYQQPVYAQPVPAVQPVPGVPVQPAAQLGAVGTPPPVQLGPDGLPVQPWQ